MRSRTFVIVPLFALVAIMLALFAVGLRLAKASQARSGRKPVRRAQMRPAQQEEPLPTAPITPAAPKDDEPIIQATELISIPFFFDELPLTFGGAGVVAAGSLTCTAGEETTIAITVTQSLSGAVATGLWEGDCTGVAQDWKQVSTIESGPLLVEGDAVACGLATSRDEGVVTESEFWCNKEPVSLVWPDTYLPFVHKPQLTNVP